MVVAVIFFIYEVIQTYYKYSEEGNLLFYIVLNAYVTPNCAVWLFYRN
jgi:hypothetical protein